MITRLRLLLAVAVLCAWTATPALCGEFKSLYDFGSNPGQLWSSVYVPGTITAPRTLIVALHGCTQDGRTYALEAGWSELADRYGWVVLLPEQPFFNNFLRCFNWFEPDKARRDRGEALSIRQMIAAVVGRYSIDFQHVFVTGLSAGGAMTAVMAADYPELFAGAAIIAGIPFDCARNLDQAQKCLQPGRNRMPAAWAKAVTEAAPAPARYPPMAIWQGDRDTVVAPINARELVEQWGTVEGVDLSAGHRDKLHGFPRTTWTDASGRAVLQLVMVPGMSHAVPVDTGHGPDSCGLVGPYMANVGVCSSLEIARFWGLVAP